MLTNGEIAALKGLSILELEELQKAWKARLTLLQKERDEAQHRFGEVEGNLQTLERVILAKKEAHDETVTPPPLTLPPPASGKTRTEPVTKLTRIPSHARELPRPGRLTAKTRG